MEEAAAEGRARPAEEGKAAAGPEAMAAPGAGRLVGEDESEARGAGTRAFVAEADPRLTKSHMLLEAPSPLTPTPSEATLSRFLRARRRASAVRLALAPDLLDLALPDCVSSASAP